MSTERDYQELYDRLLEEVGALHRANQRRIRSGMWTLLAVTVGLMLLMFLAGGNKVFTLVLWIVSMFGVAAYLIAVEYMDYELQKKLRTITKMKEDAFGRLMNVPELPHVARRLRRGALPQPQEPVPAEFPIPAEEPAPAESPIPAEEPAPAESPVPAEEPAPAESPVPAEEPAPAESPAPAEPPAPAEEPVPAESPVPAEEPAPAESPVAAEEPAPAESPIPAEEPAPAPQPVPAPDAAPRYAPLPSGWERALKDPVKLADDLALLTRALQNLSDDLRRGACDKEEDR